MNAKKIKIPIVGFDEVKFELPVFRSKRSLKPATRKNEGRPEDFVEREVVGGEVGIPRRGSEGVCSFGPSVQSFRPRPQRAPKKSALRPAGEFELEPRK